MNEQKSDQSQGQEQEQIKQDIHTYGEKPLGRLRITLKYWGVILSKTTRDRLKKIGWKRDVR